MFRRIELIDEVDAESYRNFIKALRQQVTEAGWQRYGRMTIEVCQQVGQRYRVLRIKENAVDVIYRDEFQVAVRPRRKPAVKVKGLGI